MDYHNLIMTPGFAHIGIQIFEYLDIWTLIKTRMVCQSWRGFIDIEMGHHMSAQLIGICSDQMGSRFKVESKKILRDLLKGKNKEEANHFFEFLKKYWKMQKDHQLFGFKEHGPLHLAAYRGQMEVVAYLSGQGVNLNSLDHNGKTPLDLAVWHGHKEIVKILVEGGADLNHPNQDGDTPLHTAVWCGNKEIVKILLEAGVDLNHPNGNTPLLSLIHI